jgi:hypothetical protein
MPRASVILLTGTGENWSVVGDPVRSDGWFGLQMGSHTIQITVQDFLGRVYIEGTLSERPQPNDWFPIVLRHPSELAPSYSGYYYEPPPQPHHHPGPPPYRRPQYYIQYPQNPNAPSGLNGGDRSTISYTFYGNYVFLRARMDRTYIMPVPPAPNVAAMYGQVVKILLNQN